MNTTKAQSGFEPIRVGILGAGFMGATHARAFAVTEGAHLAGLWSRSAEKAHVLAAESGARVWEDPIALIKSPDIDAVSITLPTFVHREYAIAALRAGKPVLLEKPMALTLADCDAILAAQAETGSLLMMAHTLRFWPEYEMAVALAQSGTLGAPLSAVAWRQTSHAAWSPWFADASLSGGAVLDLHIHDLDLMNWIFGAPQSIYSRGAIGPSGGYDLAMTTLDYGNAQCIVEGNGMMPQGYPFSAYLSIRCEGGVVEYTLRAAGDQVDSANQGVNSLLVHESGKESRKLEAGRDFASGDAYALEAAAFIQAVRSGTVPAGGDAQNGRLAVQTALAAHESIMSNAVVRL